jgi:hypothetical protein
MRNYLLLILTVIVFAGCDKIGDTIALTPGKATLVFPAKDALCTVGTNVTATQSTVTFSWNASENTAGYQLTIKNLISGTVTNQLATTNQLAVTLANNTPYSWYVKSVSVTSPDGVKSDEWRFYNAGLGVVSYLPFPATMVAPYYGQPVTAVSGKVTLSWTGSDVDNDIAGYKVNFGTAVTPALLVENQTTTTLSVDVISGKTYYWQIVTKDAVGNTSNSEIYKFTVN